MSIFSRIGQTLARGIPAFRLKSTIPLVTNDPTGALSGGSGWGSGWRRILEPFAGAWQRNIEIDPPQHLLAFSAVYACLSLISADISKLRIKLVEQNEKTRIWTETSSPAFSPVLRKPNRYQTRIQFLCSWMLSKLIYGNTYVLKERDDRGVVIALYILDATRVTAIVTSDGAVYYKLTRDDISQLKAPIAVPSSEIIHDRGPCLFHPLCGVPPIFACGIAATQGNKIQSNSMQFFENLSRPGGILSAPEVIDDATLLQIKTQFESDFSRGNLGRLLVVGDGLTYTAMTIPAQQAQLIEQLKWTAEDVARAFRVPLHKIATGAQPTFNNIGALNQDYYNQTLQEHIESIELLLDEGLGTINVPGRILGTELDLDGLLRMDPLTLAEVNEKGIKAGYVAANEARARANLPPVKGGEEPMAQMQYFPLSVLVKQPPPGSTPPATPALPAPAPAAPPADTEPKALEAIGRQLEERITAAAAAEEQRMVVMGDLLEQARGAGENLKKEADRIAAEAARLVEEEAHLATEKEAMLAAEAAADAWLDDFLTELEGKFTEAPEHG